MKLILFTLSIFVFGGSATFDDQLQQIQQEVEQLKRGNEEIIGVIAALKQTYDERITTQDEKIASLEQQLKSLRMFLPQSGEAYIFPSNF